MRHRRKTHLPEFPGDAPPAYLGLPPAQAVATCPMLQKKSRSIALRARLATPVAVATLFVLTTESRADPVVNFFESLGKSVSRANQNARPHPRVVRVKQPAANARRGAPKPVAAPAPTAAGGSPIDQAHGAPTAAPSAPPQSSPPQIVRKAVAINSETHSASRDIPYAIPVPNKPGYVTSPFAPNEGLVDVRGFRIGTEVKDPYTGKFFLTP